MDAATLFAPAKTTPSMTAEVKALEARMAGLQTKMDTADAWFARDDHGPDHPSYPTASLRVEALVREIGEVAGQLHGLGWYWDGDAVVSWETAWRVTGPGRVLAHAVERIGGTTPQGPRFALTYAAPPKGAA